MDQDALLAFVQDMWDAEVTPSLVAYMAIPCESPAFDAGWEASGHLDRAAELLAGWARAALRGVRGACVEVVRLPGRTPTLLIDVPGDQPGSVLFYGHFDKQPPMPGWAPGRSAWTPALEGERLYGRGGADDGYAMYSAVLACLALRAQGLKAPRCQILIEGSEESGSPDLAAYIDHLAPRLGEPDLVVALDAGCGDYERLWITTSLRGQVAGSLTVRVMEAGVHSGEASGAVPSSFRIARNLLSRLEDPDTGTICQAFHVTPPPERVREAGLAADALGAAHFARFPVVAGLRPVCPDPTELALNCTWRPQLAITGVDGLPSVAGAAAVMQPFSRLKLSLRLPPTLAPGPAAARLKTLLEAEPPYGCHAHFEVEMTSPGWSAPPHAPWLDAALDAGSSLAFGRPSARIGGGGGIPFLAMLAERFPAAQFVVTGVLGPESNAHGPNEFLHLPTARRVTAVIASLLSAAADHLGERFAGPAAA